MIKTHRSSPERPLILMQHGVGFTFGTAAYADGYGGNRHVSLQLLPSQYVADRVPQEIPAPRSVIGTPKLDIWAAEYKKRRKMPAKPVIAIAFHHGDQSTIPAEAGSAQAHYARIIPELARHFNLIGHSHPFSQARDIGLFQRAGVEFVQDFSEVMQRADIYINDCSSTAFEFLVTGKPVILLNAPWFRKYKQYGLRFWDYSNIGPQVEHPRELIDVIERTIAHPDEFAEERRNAVKNLYPHLGNAAQTAVKALERFAACIVDKTPSPAMPVAASIAAPIMAPALVPSVTPAGKIPAEVRDDQKSTGIIYMCFGEKAKREVEKSIVSLRKINQSIPVAVVGDTKVPGTQFIEWQGVSPFDEHRTKGLRFLAGRIKPHIYGLSPFQNTLYIDADTQFIGNIQPAFDFLNEFDVAIAEENRAISALHNPGPGSKYSWYHHMPEVEASIKELGDPTMHFLNSGVIFFRKSPACEKLFADWSAEWLRWKQWDEQMAFIRAVKNNPDVKLKRLSIRWNSPVMETGVIIYHMYARGAARRDGI
jgi:hypothetical protein